MRDRTSFLTNQIAPLPVNTYAIQTDKRSCKNVNKTPDKTIQESKSCYKVVPTGNFASLTKMGKHLSMMTQWKTLIQTQPERTMKSTNSKIQDFIDAQKSKKQCTRPSPTWKFSQGTSPKKTRRKIEALPVEELNTYLAYFFMTVHKQNGDEYEPSSLSSMQRSIQRHLDDQMSNINILKNDEFKQSRSALMAKRRQLVSKGKGNRPYATRALTESEEDKLFQGFFGNQDPRALQRAMWWFLSLHFGFRARDENRKLCWGDVVLSEDPDSGVEMLWWQVERGSKTRQGQEFSHQCAFNPTLHATNQDRCPVKYYKRLQRPPSSRDKQTRIAILSCSKHKALAEQPHVVHEISAWEERTWKTAGRGGQNC